jgi:hypothetical protein
MALLDLNCTGGAVGFEPTRRELPYLAPAPELPGSPFDR